MMPFIIIVLYNKAITSLSILKNATDKQYDLLIYDNSLHPQVVPTIAGFNIIYLHDANNSGVSRAYNIGALKAKELGYELILLLDQDTIFLLDYLKKYDSAYAKYKDEYIYSPIIINTYKTKIYSPAFLKKFTGKAQILQSFKFKETYNLTNKSVINSCLMIPLKIFHEIGGFNEKIRLDFSDTYFIEKYKRINPNIILINILINHSLSGDESNKFSQEYNRYKFYCHGAKELSNSLGIFLWQPPTRRLLRLILKHKSLNFIRIYYHNFIMGKSPW